MGNNVGVNGQSVVTKKSGGKVISGPDVCKTPSPGGPIPIPYMNLAQSSDLAKGSKSVQINGASVCLKDSNFSRSTGDEPGSLGGIVSGQVSGQADPLNYSFNVQIEGRNVVRNMDPFQSNNRNTPPAPILQAPVPPVLHMADDEDEQELCPYCGDNAHNLASQPGNNIGFGQALRRNIISDIKQHPWYTKPASLEAHHLVCSEALDDDEWPAIARDFGYDINHANNGVILPYELDLACQLHAPLHRGNHEKGDCEGVAYPDRIRAETDAIKRDAKRGTFCSNPKNLVDELDNLSELALSKLDCFAWSLTSDGQDYAPGGNGCAGARALPKKPATPCPADRYHGLAQARSGDVIPKKAKPLSVGR